MKMIYISDNGYQGKYKDKCLIVYNPDNQEIARYYGERDVLEITVEIDRFPEFLNSLHYQCRNCDNYYKGYCTMWHNEDGECKPVKPYQSSCRDFEEKEK